MVLRQWPLWLPTWQVFMLTKLPLGILKPLRDVSSPQWCGTANGACDKNRSVSNMAASVYGMDRLDNRDGAARASVTLSISYCSAFWTSWLCSKHSRSPMMDPNDVISPAKEIRGIRVNSLTFGEPITKDAYVVVYPELQYHFMDFTVIRRS